eukprot:3442875-Amphidinium_carterae.1
MLLLGEAILIAVLVGTTANRGFNLDMMKGELMITITWLALLMLKWSLKQAHVLARSSCPCSLTTTW